MPKPRKKPLKPHTGFPLTAHPNGQWCKKIRGKVHFFGVWADSQAALDRYLRQAADLHAGRSPDRATLAADGYSVKLLANHFLEFQSERMRISQISARYFEDCRYTLRHFAKAMGKERPVSDLRPVDFQTYRVNLTESGYAGRPWGPHALNRAITIIRCMFRYGFDNALIDEIPRFGRGFAKASALELRRAKQASILEHGKRLFDPHEVTQILQSSTPCLRAAVLLGINGGFGNTDCATLPLSAVDLSHAVIEYDRPKTGVQRTVPLWRETVRALSAPMCADLRKPANDDAARLVFLTETGLPLVRQRHCATGSREKMTNVDRLGDQFDDVLNTLGLKRRGLGFYALRHTFRTWADETNDQHAIHRIMGHAIPGMSGIYVEEIELHRLRTVVDHVHRKLFGDRSSSTISLSRIAAGASQRSASTTE